MSTTAVSCSVDKKLVWLQRTSIDKLGVYIVLSLSMIQIGIPNSDAFSSTSFWPVNSMNRTESYGGI